MRPRTRYIHYKPLFGKPMLVLQIEETTTIHYNAGPSVEWTDVVRWRNATVEDLSAFAVADMGLMP